MKVDVRLGSFRVIFDRYGNPPHRWFFFSDRGNCFESTVLVQRFNCSFVSIEREREFSDIDTNDLYKYFRLYDERVGRWGILF